MKRIALLFVLVAGLVATSAARSQQPATKSPSASQQVVQPEDSLKLKPSPELQKSLDELAAAMQALAHRIVNDPELKVAALQVATGVVNTASQVVSEQSVVLQEALKTAAERISSQSASHPHTKKP